MIEQPTALAVWEPDAREMDLYRRHYAPQTTTNDEWEIFLETCRVYHISPLRRQIYLVGRYDSVKKRTVNVPQVSIGTLRLMALRTQEFEGTTEPEWADEDGTWFTCWPKAKGKHPYAARVGIYRKNFRKPVWGVVYFHEVAQTTDVWENGRKTGEKRFTRFWEESGIHQLAKCAEADGLRKAFEEECGGVYLHEEMLQADSDNPVVSIIPEVDNSENDALVATSSAKRHSQTEGVESMEDITRELLERPTQEQLDEIATLVAKTGKRINEPKTTKQAEGVLVYLRKASESGAEGLGR